MKQTEETNRSYSGIKNIFLSVVDVLLKRTILFYFEALPSLLKPKLRPWIQVLKLHLKAIVMSFIVL